MNKPVVYVDMDGVVANFAQAYDNIFSRDAYKDDPFTVRQFCLTQPDFFKFLPVIGKGIELVDLLKDDYKVIFLTTPMPGMLNCKRDKVEWIQKYLGNYDIIFSDNKADYVVDESSVLIDDMNSNLEPWREAGGTAINIRERIDRIFEIIEEAIHGKQAEAEVKEQIADMEVEENPTEAQKESGNYKKGKIRFKKMDIRIETPKGGWRFGFDEYGKKWMNKIKCHYGYIIGKNKGTADGDHVDCFIGPNMNKSLAFVVNQNKGDGRFDEHKVLLGCNDIDEARALYLSNYQKGWEKRIDSIVQTNTKKIRDWIMNGNLDEPFQSQ